MGQLSKIAKANTGVYPQAWGYEVWLYNTNIVTMKNNVITLNTGGSRTRTTANRMNQVANEKELGFHVSFAKGTFTVTRIDKAGACVRTEVMGDTFTFPI